MPEKPSKNTVWAYVRPGEGAPDPAVQLRAIQAYASARRLVVEVASDELLPATPGPRALGYTIGGLCMILDSSVDRTVLVWDRARLCPPGWTGEHVADVLEARGLAVLEVKDAPVEETGFRERAPKKARAAPVFTESVGKRLLRGRYDGARRGKHQSGPAPFGYQRDLKGNLVPVLAEAMIVEKIFNSYLYASGGRASVQDVIDALREEGSLTRRKKQWTRAGVAWILKNDTYVGRVHFGEVKTHGTHKPLIAPIIFNKTQKKLERQDKRRRHRCLPAVAGPPG